MTITVDTSPATATSPTVDGPRRQRRWAPGVLTWAVVCLGVVALGTGLYPMTASWISSYNQSLVISSYEEQLRHVEPGARDQLRDAHLYNDALSAGVVLEENGNVPVSNGTLSDDTLEYSQILSANAQGLMARVKIPRIDVDLPVYHGTSDAVLLEGAGHLEGSHLPVGGIGTRSVVTAHRGLANATMFSDLDKVEVGDAVVIETFGEVLTYRVRETHVIAPEDTDTLRAVPGEDLVTLITCTPLGINSHRIVVTAERVTPTPADDIRSAGARPTVPGFPWWAVYGGAGIAIVLAYLLRQGFVDARAARATRHVEMSAAGAAEAADGVGTGKK
ncbi:class C sortase [Microbacterium maritypicum]|uniref:class C sortase n=1 Tax=Microbacterium maritypicum TaxID=33918 RepID=UPI003CFA695C